MDDTSQEMDFGGMQLPEKGMDESANRVQQEEIANSVIAEQKVYIDSQVNILNAKLSEATDDSQKQQLVAQHFQQQATNLNLLRGQKRAANSQEIVKYATQFASAEQKKAIDSLESNETLSHEGVSKVLEAIVQQLPESSQDSGETLAEAALGVNRLYEFAKKNAPFLEESYPEIQLFMKTLSGDVDKAVDAVNVPGILNLIFQTHGNEGVFGTGTKFKNLAEEVVPEKEKDCLQLIHDVFRDPLASTEFLGRMTQEIPANQQIDDVKAVSEDVLPKLDRAIQDFRDSDPERKARVKKRLALAFTKAHQRSALLSNKEITSDEINLSENTLRTLYYAVQKFLENTQSKAD